MPYSQAPSRVDLGGRNRASLRGLAYACKRESMRESGSAVIDGQGISRVRLNHTCRTQGTWHAPGSTITACMRLPYTNAQSYQTSVKSARSYCR